MTRRLGLKLLDLLEGTGNESNLGYYRHLDEFESVDDFLDYFAGAFAAAEPRWQAVQRALYDAPPAVAPDRRFYFTDHFVVQYETIVGIYRWARGLLEAAMAQRAGGGAQNASTAGIASRVDAAASALEKALLDRRKAEHDHWRNWYRGDRKMNLPGVLEPTLALAVRRPEVELLGVTTVTGDTQARARLVAKVLRLAGRNDVPVAAGSEVPHGGALTHTGLVRDDDPETSATYPDAIGFILDVLDRARRSPSSEPARG